MMAEATMKQLVEMCEKIGWDKGIAALEKIAYNTELMQANLYAEPETLKKAQKLSAVIIKQNIAIGRLKQIKKEKGL